MYFASQGLGKIFYPVIVGIIRLLSVSIICYYVTFYDLSLNFVFYGVSFGLLANGLGLWMCMLGPDLEKIKFDIFNDFLDYPKKEIEYIAIFNTQKNRKIPTIIFICFY